ncbi:MAG: LysR family transcriptional regulator [Burkholderiaceae bacterium]
MDRFTRIGVFVAAVDDGSFAAAARRLGMSAAMAGKYVSALEAELEVRLLQRTTRSLTLTEAGRRYYARCKRLIEAFEEANREATDSRHVAQGTLRVAAPVTFGALHLGPVVARYLEDNPRVNVEVLMDDGYADLLAAGIDVAIRIGRLEDSSLVARRIAPCRMILCASPGYLERHGHPRIVDDLLHAERLAFSQAVSAGDWTLVAPDGRARAVDGPSRLSANNMQMLSAAARAGVGIAYGPTFVFGDDIARGELVELLPDHRASDLAIHAVYPSARHVPLKVRLFVDRLAADFGDSPPWDRFRAERES